jgi:hypothetical protein
MGGFLFAWSARSYLQTILARHAFGLATFSGVDVQIGRSRYQKVLFGTVKKEAHASFDPAMAPTLAR